MFVDRSKESTPVSEDNNDVDNSSAIALDAAEREKLREQARREREMVRYTWVYGEDLFTFFLAAR